MSAVSRVTFRRAIAAGFVIATAACADNLIAPTTGAPSSISFDKKVASAAGARAFIDKLGNTFVEVSTTSAWDDHTLQPGQLTHVHFKLCKGWNKVGSPTKMFSANFHYKYPDGNVDKDHGDEPDDIDDGKVDPYRVTWNRSTEETQIKAGGYTGGFMFRNLREGDLVEVHIQHKMTVPSTKKDEDDETSTVNTTVCVPVRKAPNPTLTGAGYLGLSGPEYTSANKRVTYDIFVSDPIGTANVTGVCNLYVQSVISTTPIRMLSAPVLIGTGPLSVTGVGGGYCTFDYSFPNGGAYVISASLTGILPIDYDVIDNTGFINVNVSGPTGGGGTGGGSGPEAVVASFSALGSVQTVMTPYGPTSLTAYSDINTKTEASPAYNVGDDQPSQGMNTKVTLLKQLSGPFTVTANVSTDGQYLGHIAVSGLVLSPLNIRKAPGNTLLSPGDICTQIVTVDNPEGYQVQVCINTISNQTVYFFNAHANFDTNSGHFVPYGSTLSFESDLVAGGKHYRIPKQTFSLQSSNGVMPVCSRPTTGPVLATCSFTENTTIRAGSDAQRSNIIIYGTDN